jgi:hypothetical protein
MFINGKEFMTVADMAEREKKTANAIKLLLHKKDIRPISKDALYPIEAYEAIKDAPPPGRPKKVATAKPASKKKAK